MTLETGASLRRILQNASFHQGLHCLLRQNQSRKRNVICFENYPDLTVSNFMGNSIGIKRVENASFKINIYQDHYTVFIVTEKNIQRNIEKIQNLLNN